MARLQRLRRSVVAMRDDAWATFEEHRLFLSVAGSVLTALGALYTYEHRRFQQHELEKKIASLEEEHQHHHASGRFHRVKLITKFAFPMITVAGIVGYVIGFRTGHAAGARRQASDVVAGKKALQKLEGEQLQRILVAKARLQPNQIRKRVLERLRSRRKKEPAGSSPTLPMIPATSAKKAAP
ncbi:hypothetical protein NDN08_000027 [Rhodosorus marinus]|uniref:Transmembrane protein n=1 Tax=Rhodosorus marinus TaxID=101924 RepID=A0AAV8UE60_9RHOD|nr:hypothetical protein NDN08_000027 [Rhodosorus marinus]